MKAKSTSKKQETAKQDNTQIEYLEVTSVEVTRAHSFGEGKGCAFDMKLNGISLYNCRVVEGKQGDFISFPAYKGNDGKWYSHFWARLTDEDSKEIIAQIENML